MATVVVTFTTSYSCEVDLDELKMLTGKRPTHADITDWVAGNYLTHSQDTSVIGLNDFQVSRIKK